jgi:hypothetical protein
MDIKTSSLINDLKLMASFPDGMFTDTDFISFLNTAYFTEIVPFIMKHREEFFVSYIDYNYADTIAIPSDAMAQKLRDIVRVSGGDFIGNVPRLTLEEMSNSTQAYYRPTGFYLEDNNIKFYPKGVITDSIRLYYFKRPNYLISEDSCVKITSVNGVNASGVIPENWTTDTEISVMSQYQPYTTVDTYTIDSLSVENSTITLSASGFQVGDYICPKGYTVIPKIPVELKDCLVQASLVNALVALKDVNGSKLAREELYIAMQNASGLISPRVEGEVKKIVGNSSIWRYRNNNRSGWRY